MGKLRIAIDMDGVVDQKQVGLFLSLVTNKLFSDLEIHILTSRSSAEEVIKESLDQLQNIGIRYDHYYFLPESSERIDTEFPQDLSWFEKQIWQKAEYCKNHSINIMFEDDPKTIDLINRFSPNTKILQVR